MENLISYLSIVVIFFGSCNTNKDLKPPNILFIISDDQSYPRASIQDAKQLINSGFGLIGDRGLLFNQTYTTDLFKYKSIEYRLG